MSNKNFMKFTKDFEIFPYLIGKAKLNYFFYGISQYSMYGQNDNALIEERDEEMIIFIGENLKQKRHRKQVLKSWRFWRISLASLLLNFPVMFMVNTGRIFGALININALVLQLMGIFQAFGMVIIGPILGYVSDKKNPLTLLRIVTLICVIPGILLDFFLGNSFVFMFSLILYLFGLIGNMVGQTPLIMEVYGIQESVILGGLIATISKVSEIVSTVVAFSVSFIYKGNSIRIPYKIIYILSSVFSYYSFYLFMWEEIDKFEYDDSDVDTPNSEMNRESIVSNL